VRQFVLGTQPWGLNASSVERPSWCGWCPTDSEVDTAARLDGKRRDTRRAVTEWARPFVRAPPPAAWWACRSCRDDLVYNSFPMFLPPSRRSARPRRPRHTAITSEHHMPLRPRCRSQRIVTRGPIPRIVLIQSHIRAHEACHSSRWDSLVCCRGARAYRTVAVPVFRLWRPGPALTCGGRDASVLCRLRGAVPMVNFRQAHFVDVAGRLVRQPCLGRRVASGGVAPGGT